MFDRRRRADEPEQPPLPGVIDTFGIGFASVVGRPWVVAPLLVLELLLLFAPRLTLESDASALADRARDRGDRWEDVAAEIERLEDYNIAEMLEVGAPLVRTPVIAPAIARSNAELPGWQEFRLDVPRPFSFLVTPLAFAMGFLVAALYRLLAARAMEDESRSRLTVRVVLETGMRILGLIVCMFALMTFVTLPVLVASVGAALLGYSGAAAFLVVLVIPLFWGLLHFYFAVHAVAVDLAGPLAALKASYRVVHRNFWQALRFILVTLLISTGLGVVLQGLGDRPALVLPAVILNAFLATGMIVAAMLFYRDRARIPGQLADRSGR